MSVVEVELDEVLAFNQAVEELHELCDWARDIREAYLRGELDISDDEGWELVETVRENVEAVERWQLALLYSPMPVPAPVGEKPAEPRAPRWWLLPNCSFGAGPNVSFGNYSVGPPGNYAPR
jgi:hypothetical protein